jgi:hypothetical protein
LRNLEKEKKREPFLSFNRLYSVFLALGTIILSFFNSWKNGWDAIEPI